MTQELIYWQYKYQAGLDVALQQMFPTSADEKVDEVQSLTEKYQKYKKKYVKHLNFNPYEKNLSRCILD